MVSEDCSASYNITEETVSEWLFTPADTIIITVIIPIILGLGVITNATFLFVIYRVPKLRSVTSIYLAHLALADLLYLIMSAFYHIWRYASSPMVPHTPFMGSAGCGCFITVTNTGYFASIALVTSMSFERYLALCHPMKHLKIRGRGLTLTSLAICWLVGFAFAAVTVLSSATLYTDCLQWPDEDEYLGFPLIRSYCGPVQPWVPYYTLPLVNLPWLIAMVANIYMYARIVITLNKRGSVSRMIQDPKAVQVRNQVAKMLIVNGVVFFICQTPYRVISLTAWVSLLAQIQDPLSTALGNAGVWISSLPQLMNTFINPLIYGMMSGQYRTALIQVFQCQPKARLMRQQATTTRASKIDNSASQITSPTTTSETFETRL
ncbi:kappa-type opioid receptor-like [Asterias rubens]|uniref:kappa-type opioid receptor-like n=1 Tax=Asterias rubens TaxID=7604 RepID=UPI00145519B0|nr:kappa-type opioid receptor-like [Asterias rubens]